VKEQIIKKRSVLGDNEMYDVIIIGAGPAGSSTAKE